jgi:hypothetical protein
VIDILVLQPLNTARMLFKPANEMPPSWHPTEDPFEGAGVELFGYSEGFRQVCDWLLQGQRDFHIGNEALLGQHGSVSGPKLKVGQCSYSVVVVPPSVTWDTKTVELLGQFARAGGKVVVIRPLPTLIDGVPGKVLPNAAVEIDLSNESLSAALDALIDADVRIADAPAILVHHRRAGDSDVYFLANTSTTKGYANAHVRLAGRGPVVRWDLLSGRQEALTFEPDDQGGISVRLDFDPVASHLIVCASGEKADAGEYRAPPRRFRKVEQLGGTWKFRALDPNCLSLDYCKVRIGDGPWSDRIPTWRAHQHLVRAGVGSPFRLSFTFRARSLPSKVRLAIEDAERFSIFVNGHELPAEPRDAWWDPRLLMIDFTKLIRRGENEIEISGRFGLDSEIEPCFLVGEFGVDRKTFDLTKARSRVTGENLVDEGLPFFIGRVVLTKSFTVEKLGGETYVRFKELDAIVATVRVNGSEAGRLAWDPYVVDVSKLVRPGRNEIEVELATSLHNLLGPHHDKVGEVRHFVIDRCWMDAADWTDDYFFVPVGVQGAEVCYG